MHAVGKRADTVLLCLMSDVQTPSSGLFLKKRDDFERVKREGKRFQGSLFNVVSCTSPDGETRVGIVIGRRFGKAVVRNRAKRIFRELVRKTHRLLVKGYDIIVFPKRQVLLLKHQVLFDAWVSTMAREGLLISPDPLPCAK